VIQRDSTDGAFREGEPPINVAGPRDGATGSDAYHEPLLAALAISGILLVLSTSTSGGDILCLTEIGLVIFWGWVFYVWWRRAANPTKLDLYLIKWGCIPWVIGFQVAMYVWHLRGLW
jgi:hypothetical protein